MIHRTAPIALAALTFISLAMTACYEVPRTAVRVSSAKLITVERSTVRYARPPAEVFDALKAELSSRGFPLANQIDSKKPGEKFYVFKGARKDVTFIRGNSKIIVADTNEVGSVFIAKISAAPDGANLFLMGKPTIGGVDLCSDEDGLLADGGYWCNDSSFRADFPGLSLMTGREEMETVQGTLAALAAKLK